MTACQEAQPISRANQETRIASRHLGPSSKSAGNADSDHVLPVSCWTVVSQDNKLLTYLVDMFWTWDGTLSHLIDRELFIGDLSAAGPNFSAGQQRGFCSPFLVNTILAVASLHATRKHPDSYSEDIVTLGHKFASHAFELLESEKGVKSLTLLQGAAVLWLFASNEGSRSSRTQCASLESLLRDTWLALGLETGGSALFKFSGKDDAHDVRIWQAVSHITWGFTASLHMLVSRPLIMKTFEDLEAQRGSGSPASVSSSGEDSIANQTSYQLQVFSAKCSLCEIADQFMSMFVNNGQMLLLDSGHCTALYNKLLCWKLSLPDHLMTSNSVSSSLLLLQATYDFVALKLLFSYTSHAGTDLFDGRNAASLQVLHASSMITNLWIYRGIYTIKHEYWAAEYCSFVAHALLPRLESDASAPAVQDIIGRACCVLNEMALAGVSGRAQELLAGVEERARSFKMRVPSYGRKSATHESATPMVLIRGVQVFDGARAACWIPRTGRTPSVSGRLSNMYGQRVPAEDKVVVRITLDEDEVRPESAPYNTPVAEPERLGRHARRRAENVEPRHAGLDEQTKLLVRRVAVVAAHCGARIGAPSRGRVGRVVVVVTVHTVHAVGSVDTIHAIHATALRGDAGRTAPGAGVGGCRGRLVGLLGRRASPHHAQRRHKDLALGGHLARHGGVESRIKGCVGEDVEPGAHSAFIGCLSGGAGNGELAMGVSCVDDSLEDIVRERVEVDDDFDKVCAVWAARSRRNKVKGVLARANDRLVGTVI
ncbi:C6 transcription factor [Colletotrichum tofieldiae]|nr:C6 transcription factor [Colletotrichum tofieldiae]